MARKDRELDDLRKQVKARQRAAGQKISRLRGKGVELAGTKYDPRRNPANIDRYNRKQLTAHLARLNSFTDRRNQPVGDAYRRPLPQSEWEKQKTLERQMNRRKREAFNKVKNIVLPGKTPITIGQRQKIITPDRPTAGNPSVNPYFLRVRNSKAFKNATSLKKMNEFMRKRLAKDFIDEDIKLARRVARDMTKDLGRPDIQARLAKLTQRQFDILWNFSGFADDLAIPYALYKGGKSDIEDSWQKQRLDAHLETALEKITWAESQKI